MSGVLAENARLRGRLWNAGIAILSPVIFFLLIEGLFSTYIAWRTIFPTYRLAEHHHTQHDPLLGWVNIPGFSRPDFYGPGRDLTINGQGFRANREYAPESSRAKRLICSGDSFAMGYGVGDRDTWCHSLSELSPDLETVNMGQGGYGIDQAYLWYRRDAAPLAHQIHLFTLTTGDFERTAADEFSGYRKPVLAVRDGGLVVANAPIPDEGAIGALRRSPFKLLAFRSVRALFSFSRSLEEQARAQDERQQGLWRVVAGIFADLAALNRERQSTLVAVHLPTEREYRDGGRRPERIFLRRELRRLGIPYWDLLEDFQELSRDELGSYFIPTHDPLTSEFPGAGGHYNERGNAFVAERLWARLRGSGLLPSTGGS